MSSELGFTASLPRLLRSLTRLVRSLTRPLLSFTRLNYMTRVEERADQTRSRLNARRNMLRFGVAPWLVFAGALVSMAQDAANVAAEARAERPNLLKTFPEALAVVSDNPRLPRVLLIGDSISIGYTPIVRELLGGVANVHRIPDNGGPTLRGVVMLEEWLEGGRWNVIHFNFGLHDIARVNEGRPRTAINEYGANLRSVVERLRATGAKLIFATTTPVPLVDVRPVRRNSDVIVYNALATAIVGRDNVSVDDLYTLAQPRLGEIQQPANVHFTPAGYRVLGEAVAAAIKEQLANKAAPAK